MTYLEALAKHIIAKEGCDLSAFCFVFPNRRSGLFFKRYLLNMNEGVSWAPEVLTINELMLDISDLQQADQLDVLFMIYDIYKGLSVKPESFDTFYPWAEMMLSDFDTLDKYLVDPASIFRNIEELKEIDETFGGLEEEQVAYIRKFWKSFFIGEMTHEKDAFLSTWKLLPKIYSGITKRLKESGEAYEGMVYRSVAELEIAELNGRLRKDKYVFVGFNALSLSEKRLFGKLNMKGVASFYWDYDEKYVKDYSMEAGRFMRENLESFPSSEKLDIYDNLKDLADIRIFDLPSDILQTKTIHKILKLRNEKIESATDTAIVACDENLLMPILVSLPEEVEEVNITMGYPFRNTPLNSFIEGVLKLQNNVRRRKSGELSFYHKDVLSILNHQYFLLMSEDNLKGEYKEIVEGNLVYVEPELFKGEFSKLIFKGVNSLLDFCAYLEDIMRYLLRKIQAEEGTRHQALELEYIYLVLSRLNKIWGKVKGRDDLEMSTFIKLFRKVLSGQRVPFTGEPLAGLQVMGILETRLLDFKHVIMLSVNEDIMPRAVAGHSFIPYSLRYAYGLPVREDMDAIYAYYFFRLLQRAEKVDLMFNSASDGVKNGEMSRYLYQLHYSYNAKIIRPVLSVNAIEKAPVTIQKTPELMDVLKKYYLGNDKNRYLSPSALNAYVECSLKFYFQRVAGIRQEEELLEELDAIGFGNILHDTMHLLYENLSQDDGLLTEEKLKSLLLGSHVNEVLSNVFKDEYFKGGKHREIEGKNLIIFEIIKKYVRKIVELDMKIAPLRMHGLEAEFEHYMSIQMKDGEQKIAIGGKIDRIDEVNGVRRIIDYKTGNVKMTMNSVAALFDRDEKNRSKEAFQAFMYSYLYQSQNEGQDVQPGLYVTRELFKEGYQPEFKIGASRKKVNVLSFSEHRSEFEDHLRRLIEELYDINIPFQQTTISERCRYCEFNTICQH